MCYTNTPQVIDVLDRAEEMKNANARRGRGAFDVVDGRMARRNGAGGGGTDGAKEGGTLQLGWKDGAGAGGGGNGGGAGRRRRMDGYGR